MRLTDGLFLALGVLTAWDIVSTLYVITSGGREMNPLLAKIFTYMDAKYSLPMLKILFLVLMGHLWPMLALEVMVAIVAIYLVVGLNNLNVILKIKRTR